MIGNVGLAYRSYEHLVTFNDFGDRREFRREAGRRC